MAGFNYDLLQRLLTADSLWDPTDWWVGLYSTAADPFLDLFTAEVSVARQYMGNNLQWSGTEDYYRNINAVIFENCPTVQLAGWFLVNQVDGDVPAWIGAFAAPVWVYEGDTLIIDSNSLYVGLSTTTTVTDPGGGGGMPG
jgi:hypothetical protein